MSDITMMDAMIGGTLKLEFMEARLKQPQKPDAELRQGTATVTLTPVGTLELNVTLTHAIDFVRSLDAALSMVPGQVIGEHEFYQLDARTVDEKTWTCDRFLAADQLSWQPTGNKMKGNLPRLQMTLEGYSPVNGHHLYLAIAGSLPLPYFGSGAEINLEFPLSASTTVRLTPKAGCVLLHARSVSEPVDTDLIDRLLEALSIATGRWARWFYRRIQLPTASETTLASFPREKANETLWTAINENDPESLMQFIRCYLELSAQGPPSFFGYWQKVFTAWQAGILIAALPVSIYIEGLVKEYFPDHMPETQDVLDAADAMIRHLDTAPVNEDLRKRGQGAVKNIKGKSVASALKKLAAERWFDENLVPKWRNVRNTSAHAHEFTPTLDVEKQQAAMDDVMACLHLFYVLLFIKTRFAGEFADFSQYGFPRTRLVPMQPTPVPSPVEPPNATLRTDTQINEGPTP